MSEKRNVPRLRFSEFKPNWEIRRLEELFSEFRSGIGITSREIAASGQYPVYGENGLRGYTDSFTHEGEYLLIVRQGALCGNINLISGKNFISEHAIAGKSNSTSDTKWLAKRLDYLNLNRLSESSAQPGLSVNKLLRIKLTIPGLPEQQKIAGFLTDVDRRIELLQQKKEKLERYKKGVMQQLFTRKIRFKADDGSEFPAWEEKKLGDVYGFRTTNSFSRDKLNYESGEYRNIHYGDIHTKFPTIVNLEKIDLPYINEDVEIRKTFSDNRVEAGDLIIADASEDYADIGKTIEIVNTAGQKVLAGLHARRRDTNVEIGFGGYLMKSEPLRTQVKRIAQGTKVSSVSVPRMLELDLRIPCLEEQTKVVHFLRSLDENSEKLSHQIHQSQIWKKGLLQQMFV